MLLISPYVESRLFAQLMIRLKPKKLFVVLDAGCRRQDISMIKKECREAELVIASARSTRLTHIKLIYIEERPNLNLKSRIITGSANATWQGFSGENSEALLTSPTSRASSVSLWAKSVITAMESGSWHNISECNEELSAVTIFLPILKLQPLEKSLTEFDSWVQRGYLLTPHARENTFLQIPVPLKQPLPTGDIGERISSVGLVITPTRSLSYKYLRQVSLPEEDSNQRKPPLWKTRYFTDTRYGAWCSDDCFDERQGSFLRRDHAAVERALDQLKNLRDEASMRETVGRFTSTLQALWKKLGNEASKYLHDTHKLNEDRYVHAAKEKIQRDLHNAEDKDFRTRLLAGFYIAPVPRFREDIDNWEAFVNTLATMLATSYRTKKRSNSKLLSAFLNAIDLAGEEKAEVLVDSESSLLALRRYFASEELSKILRNYHSLQLRPVPL